MIPSHSCATVRHALAVVTVLGATLLPSKRAEAQFPGQKAVQENPFVPKSIDDFDKFFEQMFGGSNEGDQKQLEAIEVSPEEERELGKQMVDAWRAEMKRQRIKIVEAGPDVVYLTQLVETLKPHMQNAERYPTIRVLVFDTPHDDARSFPGGTLTFSRGMLNVVDSEAALVGVVGHELSHLDHGHQLLPIRRMKLMQQTPFNGGTFSPQSFASRGELLMRLWKPFRPADEAAADRDATDWSFAAGYDPQALSALFDKLQQKHPSQPIPAMFRSHPATIERFRAVTARADELERQDPQKELYLGKENLRRRIPRSKQDFAE